MTTHDDGWRALLEAALERVTVPELAARVGVSKRSISRWRNTPGAPFDLARSKLVEVCQSILALGSDSTAA